MVRWVFHPFPALGILKMTFLFLPPYARDEAEYRYINSLPQ